MRVLITGIGGLLGSRLAGWLLDNVPDVEIAGMDDWSCGYLENVPRQVRILEHSLGSADPDGVPAVVTDLFAWWKPDYVFHFAAYAAEGLSPFIRRYNYRNNLLATAELISAAIEAGCVRRFVFTSSMAVYGRGNPPFAEDHPINPIDPYGIAKLACERDLAVAGEQHGLDWCVIRPHNVYGINQDIWTPYRNVLGIWMARALAELPLRIYGDGRQQRAFSWIDDCLPCLWRAATEPAASRQIINLGGTRPVTIGEAAEMVRAIIGRGEIEYHEPRHEVSQAWCTWQKSVDLLGHADATPLYQGIRAMWKWAQDAWQRYPSRQHPRHPWQLETQRGLYSYWAEPECEHDRPNPAK